jgi:spore coat protein H
MKKMMLLLVPMLVVGQVKNVFEPGKIWTVHVKMDAAQYAAMEPKGGPGGPGGPGGGMRGGMRPPGMGPGFGPGMLLEPAFLKADANGDGKITREEFAALGDGWFASWAKKDPAKMSEAELRAGVASVVTMPGGMPGGPGPMMGMDFPYAHAQVEFEGVVLDDVAVRYKGNATYMASRGQLKRSLKLNLNKYVKGQKLAGQKTINLHSGLMDGSFLKERIGYQLFRDAGVPAPRVSYAKVYLTVAGKYDKQLLGLYTVVEELDEAIDTGLMFKPELRGGLFADLGEDWSRYKKMYDPKSDVTAEQKQRFMETVKLVSHANDAEFRAKAETYIDVPQMAKYLAVNVWQANMDSILGMGHNFYLVLDRKTNRFQMLPWDLDLSFGGMGGGTEMSIAKPWRGENRFLERLFGLESFQKAYHEELKQLSGKVLEPARIEKLIAETKALIDGAVQEDKAARPAQGQGGFGGMRGPGGPGGPGGPPIESFVVARGKSVSAQLRGESKGSEAGGFGPGGGGRGGGGFPGPGMMLAGGFQKTLDGDHDQTVTKEEFRAGMEKWFAAWSGGEKTMTVEQLKQGIAKDLAPPMPMGGPMGPPPFED